MPAAERRAYLQADERRRQILQVAGRLFSERHYEAVSMAEVAREAGIARGLLHHYFGTKRELYLEVVRAMLAVPDDLFIAAGEGDEQRDEVLRETVDRWLRTIKANRGTWLASVGAQGYGRDPELEAVVQEARDRITDRLIALTWGPPERAPREVHALLNGYVAFADAVTADWLLRRRLSRAAVHQLLLQSLLSLVDHALPAIQADVS
jgi:AcrR family transcriptional regulator